jgi:copper chaperone NosL
LFNVNSVKTINRLLTASLAAVSAVLLLLSLKYPLWQMRLEAPQYRDQEALNITVHPGALGGDLRELKVLNQYIGVHVPPTLPQFKWLPATLVLGAVLAFAGGLLGRPARQRALSLVAGGLAAALLVAAIQAKVQIRQIGHNRDQKTILAGIHDFTPPFLGTSRIAQFTVSSRFGVGAWLIGGALALQLGASWMSRRPASPVAAAYPAELAASTRLTQSPA